MMTRLDFTNCSDPVGLEIRHDGQRYTVVGVVPHRRIDGSDTRLIIWKSNCADCGAEFVIRTPLKLTALNRRCETHKAPGRRVKQMAGDLMSNYTISPDDAAQAWAARAK